ncbi:hypothetical protein [Actinokineospora sp. NBRC 105648]|uniref:hypothetical protein n=1 Tax=Actinokineospora sp. NBRC 105648 TaxID=3032206 RepID=UPI0024A4A557|nr:hypothetical protein [Actinokineospora sp. NBRC 105648]GLZ37771.1 hypothetical protein Acsp05_13960 [Actinokineospora sp. NBRC 105648]
MAAWNELPAGTGSSECEALVDVADRLRSSAPELAVQFAARSLGSGAATPAVATRAHVLLGTALVRLGRHAEAVEPGVAALRAVTSGGQVDQAAAVRVALAACARVLGEPLVGCEFLRPVLQTKTARPAVRAAALGQFVACAAHVGGRDDLEDALGEADRLLAADEDLGLDERRLERSLLAVRASSYHRRHGDTEAATESAREGLSLLNRVADTGTEGGLVRSRLVLELVCALLDDGDVDEASRVAATALLEPVRATSAMALGRMRLALATRVLLPSGRAEHGRALLTDVVRSAERHGLDSLQADAWTFLAHAEEEASHATEALHALRSARAAEYRYLRAGEAARSALTAEVGAVHDAENVISLLRNTVRPAAVAVPAQQGTRQGKSGPGQATVRQSALQQAALKQAAAKLAAAKLAAASQPATHQPAAHQATSQAATSQAATSQAATNQAATNQAAAYQAAAKQAAARQAAAKQAALRQSTSKHPAARQADRAAAILADADTEPMSQTDRTGPSRADAPRAHTGRAEGAHTGPDGDNSEPGRDRPARTDPGRAALDRAAVDRTPTLPATPHQEGGFPEGGDPRPTGSRRREADPTGSEDTVAPPDAAGEDAIAHTVSSRGESGHEQPGGTESSRTDSSRSASSRSDFSRTDAGLDDVSRSASSRGEFGRPGAGRADTGRADEVTDLSAALFAAVLVRISPVGVADPVEPIEAPVPVGGEVTLNALATHVRDLAPGTAELLRSDRGEFAVLLPETTLDEAEQLATAIRETAEEAHWLIDDHGQELTIRTGVAARPGTPDGPDEGIEPLLLAARNALTTLDVTAPAPVVPRRADNLRRAAQAKAGAARRFTGADPADAEDSPTLPILPGKRAASPGVLAAREALRQQTAAAGSPSAQGPDRLTPATSDSRPSPRRRFDTTDPSLSTKDSSNVGPPTDSTTRAPWSPSHAAAEPIAESPAEQTPTHPATTSSRSPSHGPAANPSAEHAPADSKPANFTPADSTPAGSAPADSTLADSALAGSAPADSTRAPSWSSSRDRSEPVGDSSTAHRPPRSAEAAADTAVDSPVEDSPWAIADPPGRRARETARPSGIQARLSADSATEGTAEALLSELRARANAEFTSDNTNQPPMSDEQRRRPRRSTAIPRQGSPAGDAAVHHFSGGVRRSHAAEPPANTPDTSDQPTPNTGTASGAHHPPATATTPSPSDTPARRSDLLDTPATTQWRSDTTDPSAGTPQRNAAADLPTTPRRSDTADTPATTQWGSGTTDASAGTPRRSAAVDRPATSPRRSDSAATARRGDPLGTPATTPWGSDIADTAAGTARSSDAADTPATTVRRSDTADTSVPAGRSAVPDTAAGTPRRSDTSDTPGTTPRHGDVGHIPAATSTAATPGGIGAQEIDAATAHGRRAARRAKAAGESTVDDPGSVSPKDSEGTADAQSVLSRFGVSAEGSGGRRRAPDDDEYYFDPNALVGTDLPAPPMLPPSMGVFDSFPWDEGPTAPLTPSAVIARRAEPGPHLSGPLDAPRLGAPTSTADTPAQESTASSTPASQARATIPEPPVGPDIPQPPGRTVSPETPEPPTPEIPEPPDPSEIPTPGAPGTPEVDPPPTTHTAAGGRRAKPDAPESTALPTAAALDAPKTAAAPGAPRTADAPARRVQPEPTHPDPQSTAEPSSTGRRARPESADPVATQQKPSGTRENSNTANAGTVAKPTPEAARAADIADRRAIDFAARLRGLPRASALAATTPAEPDSARLSAPPDPEPTPTPVTSTAGDASPADHRDDPAHRDDPDQGDDPDQRDDPARDPAADRQTLPTRRRRPPSSRRDRTHSSGLAELLAEALVAFQATQPDGGPTGDAESDAARWSDEGWPPAPTPDTSTGDDEDVDDLTEPVKLADLLRSPELRQLSEHWPAADPSPANPSPANPSTLDLLPADPPSTPALADGAHRQSPSAHAAVPPAHADDPSSSGHHRAPGTGRRRAPEPPAEPWPGEADRDHPGADSAPWQSSAHAQDPHTEWPDPRGASADERDPQPNWPGSTTSRAQRRHSADSNTDARDTDARSTDARGGQPVGQATGTWRSFPTGDTDDWQPADRLSDRWTTDARAAEPAPGEARRTDLSGLPTPPSGIRGRHRSSEWAPADIDSGG